MALKGLEKYYLPILCNILAISFVVIPLIAIIFSHKSGLFEATPYLPIVLYLFLATMVFTLGLSLFVGISFIRNHDHKAFKNQYERYRHLETMELDAKFLIINQGLLTILFLVMAICSLAMKDQFFQIVEYIFDDYAHGIEKAGKFVNNTEKYFDCHDFKRQSPLGNCASNVKIFLDSKLYTIFVVFLSISMALIVFLATSFYIICTFSSKKKKSKSTESSTSLQQTLKQDIQLNDL